MVSIIEKTIFEAKAISKYNMAEFGGRLLLSEQPCLSFAINLLPYPTHEPVSA